MKTVVVVVVTAETQYHPNNRVISDPDPVALMHQSINQLRKIKPKEEKTSYSNTAYPSAHEREEVSKLANPTCGNGATLLSMLERAESVVAVDWYDDADVDLRCRAPSSGDPRLSKGRRGRFSAGWMVILGVEKGVSRRSELRR